MGPQHITITSRPVETVTTSIVLKRVQSGKMNPTRLITHHFELDSIREAYDAFGAAAKTGALKVIIEA